jgi:hypothetical protein
LTQDVSLTKLLRVSEPLYHPPPATRRNEPDVDLYFTLHLLIAGMVGRT